MIPSASKLIIMYGVSGFESLAIPSKAFDETHGPGKGTAYAKSVLEGKSNDGTDSP